MTGHRPWTARSRRRRLRRRRTLLRVGTAGACVALAAATVVAVLAVVRSPTGASAPVHTAPAGVEDGPLARAGPPSPAVPSNAVPVAPTRAARPAPARVPTPEDPLRVWIAGDSMWELAGPALADLLESTGVATAEVDVRYSSGLTRPDFFDWSMAADEALRLERPEVVVVLMGANDAQPLVVGDTVLEPGTPDFAAAYGTRVATLMARLAEDDRQVVWVGLPVMRPTGYDVRIADLTAVQQAAAARTPGVVFVPTRALFADADGRYVDALPDDDGMVRVLRGADGIHLSPEGAARLAAHVFAHVGLTTEAPIATDPTEEPVP